MLLMYWAGKGDAGTHIRTSHVLRHSYMRTLPLTHTTTHVGALVCQEDREDLADEAPNEWVQRCLLVQEGPQHEQVAITIAELFQNGEGLLCLGRQDLTR